MCFFKCIVATAAVLLAFRIAEEALKYNRLQQHMLNGVNEIHEMFERMEKRRDTKEDISDELSKDM